MHAAAYPSELVPARRQEASDYAPVAAFERIDPERAAQIMQARAYRDARRVAGWLSRRAAKVGIATFASKGAFVRWSMTEAREFFGRQLTSEERDRVLAGCRLAYPEMLSAEALAAMARVRAA